MSNPPHDRLEFWIRFGCAFIFSGAILFLLGLRIVDQTGLIPGVCGWAVSVTAISVYAALRGDSAWEFLINLFRWF